MKRLFPPGARKLLGNMQDKQLAERLGIAARTVYRERKRLGIDKPPRTAPLTASQKSKVLKHSSVHAAAQSVGVSERAVRRLFEESGRPLRRPDLTPIPKAALRQLGKKPDTEIARAFDVTPARIRNARTHLEIASYRARNVEQVGKRALKVIQNKTVREASEILGLPEHRITRIRSRLGIFKRKPALTKREIADAAVLSVEDYARKHKVDLSTARSRRARFSRANIKTT